MIHPHPALKVVVPMNPMVDGWMGDDWFHNGAFRAQNLPYVYDQVATRDNKAVWWSNHYDDYDLYMHYGSAGAMGKALGWADRLYREAQLGFAAARWASPGSSPGSTQPASVNARRKVSGL